MTELQRLIVRVLAQSDAVHFPPRRLQWNTFFPRHAYQLRQQHAEAGLPYRSGGQESNEWQRSSRLVRDAANDGLLVVRTASGSKFPLVKLTDSGELLG